MSLYTYDVFISYSHDDSDWVRNTLLKELDDRGFKVAIDFRILKGGPFLIDQLEEVIEQSKHVIAVFSPNYIKSEWGKFENVLARTDDPDQSERRLIPVIYKATTLSLSIRAIAYLDFTKEDEWTWKRLVDSII